MCLVSLQNSLLENCKLAFLNNGGGVTPITLILFNRFFEEFNNGAISRRLNMSVREKNRMLHILLRNGTDRKQMSKIMEDLKEAGIFDEVEMEDDLSLLEQEADIIFSDKEPSQKVEEILLLKQESPQESRHH